MSENLTKEEVASLIEVRSEPHIYAFSTNTIPNFIKIGDTFRPISKRLEEWKKEYRDLSRVFPNITAEVEGLAKVNDEIYFRDYSLHTFLKNKGFNNLSKNDFVKKFGNIYFSNEFFEGVTIDDIKRGLIDIKDGYQNQNTNYQYYKISERKPTDRHWNNDRDWKLRENQKIVVENFIDKVRTEKELLMYAVMRFGKSFTALSCANAICHEKGKEQYKKVLVVSAKADVLTEWKKTVEMPRCFKDYRFLHDKDFVNDPNVIENTLNHNVEEEFRTKSAIVAFLTLQNLSGKSADGLNIKKKLEKVLQTEFDLIIIDETHFGAWASTYGAPLSLDEDKEFVEHECEENKKFIDTCNAKLHGKVKLHLSGTPYNLLYNEKFTENNIIATCQFSDILKDKEAWYLIHKEDIDSGNINPETSQPYEEYDNPYFGFPKMLRFAFNLPLETQNKLKALNKDGNTWTLNHFLATNKNDIDTKFIHEEDVLKLLQVIDGSESDDRILSFLDIPKIKENEVCKHIVIVLPFKYSCDAMESLINNNKNKFIHLKDYEVLNITGHNLKQELDSVDKVKTKISEYERFGKKTITLTVNKMLTGVTVPEWDTMIMLKNTRSAQEYDQAIFRIQNQYIKEIEEIADTNNKKVSKIDMKPQTILVDFDPIRMFELQGLSTRTINKVKEEQKDLTEALNIELNHFPIIAYNANKLVKVTPTNIVELISSYNENISILESSNKVDLDEFILTDSDIFDYIISQSAKGISSEFSGKMHEGETGDIDIDDINRDETDDDIQETLQSKNVSSRELTKDDKKELIEKYRKCIARLMFFAFLTKSDVNTLSEIVKAVEEENEYQADNVRIFTNLQLDLNFIKKHIQKCRRGYAIDIDNAIIQANLLSKDENLTQEQRVNNALARFNRISESEIVMPIHICNNMYNCIGKNKLKKIIKNGGKILDIASKTGEFTVSLFELLKNNVDFNKFKNCIYSIPTSTITYEFTRKIYEILNIPVDHIAAKVTSFDLLKVKEILNGKVTNNIDYDKISQILSQKKTMNNITINDTIEEGGQKVKFNVIVGNPPYQENDGGASASAKPIYNNFVNICKSLRPEYICTIMPSRWYSGGKGLDEFRDSMLNDTSIYELHDFTHPEDIFPGTNNRGGVCYFASSSKYNNLKSLVNVVNHINKDDINKMKRPLKLKGMDIFIRYNQMISIIDKVLKVSKNNSFSSLVSPRKPFGIESNIVKTSEYRDNTEGMHEPILCFGKNGKKGYVEKSLIISHKEWINNFKVCTPRANNIGTELNDDNLNSFISAPSSVCTEAFIVIGADVKLNQTQCENICKYMKTKFMRIMHSVAKASQDASRQTYKFVPMQDFSEKSDINWSKSIHEIDEQLYKKYKLDNKEISFIQKMIKSM